MRLATRLIVVFVLLSIVPEAVVGYLAYANGRQVIEASTNNHLISTALLKEDEVERWVDSSQVRIRLLAQRPSMRDLLAANIAAHDPTDPEHQRVHTAIRDGHLLPTLQEGAGFVELFILRASDGLVLISTDETQEGTYRASEPYFAEGRSRTYVQNAYYSAGYEEALMTISTPLQDGQGNLLAVLAGNLDLAELSEIMAQSSDLSPSEDTYLINKSGFFVTAPRFGQDYLLKETLYTDGVAACLAHNDGVGLYDDYRGVPVLGSYRWMPELELCILTEVDQAEAFAPIVVLGNAVLRITAVVVFVAALLGLVLAGTITRPIRQLLEGTEQVGRGNLECRIAATTTDEIGQLATAFNEMAANLQRSTGETEQRAEALQQSEEKYRTLAEGLNEVMYRADPQTFVTTYVNKAIETVYGYTAEEWLADPSLWERCVHPEDRERVLAEFRAAQTKPEDAVVSYRIIRKDQMVRWVEDHVTWAKDQRGQVVSMNGLLYDITIRKRAEEALQQRTVQLEAANQELEAFTYTVSHDLRTPLRAMDGFSRILLEEHAAQLAPELQHYLQVVRDNAQQMGRLVDDLLSFSRLSRQALHKQTVAPAGLLRQALEQLRAEEDGRTIEFTMGDLPACQADPILLTQVFVNLLSNALKFTRKREVARIEVGSLPIADCRLQIADLGGSDAKSAISDLESAIYFVRDNGVGFDMRYVDKLFAVFQRLHRAEEYEGTGVGLAIVQRIIHRHGGRVWAEAELDKGATFYFTI
jgi:PAS domain S-box-containing protein